jgi:hypothetical protein
VSTGWGARSPHLGNAIEAVALNANTEHQAAEHKATAPGWKLKNARPRAAEGIESSPNSVFTRKARLHKIEPASPAPKELIEPKKRGFNQTERHK